ncbi:nucleotide exchange factor GrpE [Scytonema sp. UIC 10036]|uniref:nucleotide exchange factor GrpE n=1 Tax=Scytonema sp. UIC 10036 TaxID=2304196 RepID=UPI0012DA812A|nr:nucleotide exchange factor GrpE [Scytonema sp. UIC 10036]MUG96845.1 nucleotide exchange factor GrpE [Scytonema sp. UIC 10036]
MYSKSWSEVVTNLSKIFPWFTQYHQAQELALTAEASVRRLSGLSLTSSDERDIISVLNSTCLLLDRLVENPQLLQTDQKHTPVVTEQITAKEIPLPTVEALVAPEIIPEVPTLEIAPEPKLSATGEELIKLRDWVLLAKTGGAAPKAEMLEVLYQKLGQILAKEGVTPIEEVGIFNYERQQVISTQATDDSEKQDCICDTVRPGYLFNGKLIRPQEVIIYTFDASDSSVENSVN